MELKTLIQINWHRGVPDGEEKFHFIVDEFDIDNEAEAKRVIINELTEYGVELGSIREFEKRWGTEYSVKAEIARFDKEREMLKKIKSDPKYANLSPLSFKQYPDDYDITIQCSYVWQHRGKLYEVKELEL